MIFYVSIAKVIQLPVGGGKNTSICKIIYAPIELFARGDTKISDI